MSGCRSAFAPGEEYVGTASVPSPCSSTVRLSDRPVFFAPHRAFLKERGEAGVVEEDLCLATSLTVSAEIVDTRG